MDVTGPTPNPSRGEQVSSVSEIPALIVRVRRDAGLSQAELAARIGSKQSAVSRWERGQDEPRVSTLARIMAACGRSLRLVAELDDVDHAQIRQQLAMTPEQRLASITNLSRVLASSRPVS